MHRHLLVLPCLLIWVVVGCDDDAAVHTPETGEALVAELTTLRDAARVAAKAAEPLPEIAGESAERARALLTAYREAHAAADDDDPAPLEAVTLVVEAERWSKVAAERVRLAGDLDGFVARSYRATRGTGFKAVFTSLGFAARQVDERGLDNLPQTVIDAAQTAATFAETVSGGRIAANGKTDWAAIANDMDAYADDPPPALRQLIALAWLTAGQSGVALAELETVDPATITRPKQRASHHLLRGLLYRMRGYPTLGAAELDAVAEYDEELGEYGPELQSGAYVLIAAMQVRDGRYAEADKMIAEAVRTWPDNPLAIYVTGERLAETGEYVAAADTLEAAAKDTKWAWLAEKIAGRARQMRDGEHDSEPLIYDPSFLRRVALRYVWEVADSSEPAAKFRDLLDASRSFGGRLVDKIPGLGTDEPAAPAE